MNKDALLLALLFRRATSINKSIIAAHRTGVGAEYYRSRVQSLNQLFEIPRQSLVIDSLNDFPSVCVCGSLISANGSYLQQFCPSCFGRKPKRSKWESLDFFDFLSSYFNCSLQTSNLYYAKAISIDQKRINQNESSST